jgi:hypothetical protein
MNMPFGFIIRSISEKFLSNPFWKYIVLAVHILSNKFLSNDVLFISFKIIATPHFFVFSVTLFDVPFVISIPYIFTGIFF